MINKVGGERRTKKIYIALLTLALMLIFCVPAFASVADISWGSPSVYFKVGVDTTNGDIWVYTQANTPNVGTGYVYEDDGVLLFSANFNQTLAAGQNFHWSGCRVSSGHSAYFYTSNIPTHVNSPVFTLPTPNAPKNFNISGTGNSITLNWDANPSSDNVALYKIYDSGVYQDSVTGTSYSINNLSLGSHQFQVSAVNTAGGESLLSNILIYNVVPSTPTISISNVTATSAMATWTSTPNATYDITINGVFLINTSTPTYNFSSLTQLQSYNITIVTKTSYGNSDLGTASFTTLKLPDSPTGLKATNVTTSSVDLSWDAVPDSISYILDQNGDVLDTTTNNFYHATGLSSDTTYTYQIAVITPGGQSDYSDPVSITTLGVPPMTPSGLSADNITSTSFTGYWMRQSDATGYKVFLNGTYVADVPQTILLNPSYNFRNLNSGSVYAFSVIAMSQNGESSASDLFSVTLIPVAPKMMKAINVFQTSVDLTWEAPNGAKSFKVYKDDNPISTVTSTSYHVVNLAPQTAYNFQVSAVNDSGESSLSNKLTVRTESLPPAPPLPGVNIDRMSGDFISNIGSVAKPMGGLLAIALAIKAYPLISAAVKALYLKHF